MNDEFSLFDLKVSVEQINGTCTCNHKIGDYFELHGGKLHVPADQTFCVFALQSCLPLLPAKQRITHPNDWMSTDSRICCPDPACGLIMLIERTKLRSLRHSETSASKLT